MRDSALSRVFEVRRQTGKVVAGVKSVFASPDGRWAIVSTGITASVAMTVVWLALAAAPPGEAATYEPRRTEAALPYDILAGLPGARPRSFLSQMDQNPAECHLFRRPLACPSSLPCLPLHEPDRPIEGILVQLGGRINNITTLISYNYC